MKKFGNWVGVGVLFVVSNVVGGWSWWVLAWPFYDHESDPEHLRD